VLTHFVLLSRRGRAPLNVVPGDRKSMLVDVRATGPPRLVYGNHSKVSERSPATKIAVFHAEVGVPPGLT